MEEEEIASDVPRSGSFLRDIEVTVSVRSGQTDLSEINKLLQVIVTSVKDILDSDEIVLTETLLTYRSTPKGKVSNVRTTLVIS